MAEMLHVRPVNGGRVLDPDAVPVPVPLPAEGKIVVDKPYWRRRLRAREVEMVPAAQPGKAAAQGEKNGPAKGK